MKKVLPVLASIIALSSVATANNGFYVGVGAVVGGELATIKGNGINIGGGNTGAVNLNGGTTIGGGDVIVGYNYVTGQFVMGLDLSLGFKGGTLNESVAATVSGTSYTVTTSIKQNFGGRLAARFGYMIAPKTMAFLSVGAAMAKFKTTTNASGFAAAANTNKTKIGFSVGGGFEADVATNVKARVEYIFNRYNNVAGSGSKLTVSEHLARFAVFYAF